MSATWNQELPWEIERYELSEHALDLTMLRRDFFRVLGGGLVVLALWRDDTAEAQQPGGRGRRGGGGGAPAPREIGAWLHIAEDGAITVYTGKAEVGQNIRTSLTQAVAEELRLKPERINLVMADTGLTPFDMGTFGSRTTPSMSPQLRRAAAAAREVLLDLAAEKLKVDRKELQVAEGKVTHPASNRSAQFGELTEGKKLMQAIGESVPTTPAQQWQTSGHTLRKVNGRDLVTGKHEYSSDIKRPGMLVGKVLRPGSYGARLKSLDASAAEKMEGVQVIRDGDFIGVVAPDEHTATRALAALKADWETTSQPSDSELFALLKRTASPNGSNGNGSSGSGLAQAHARVEQTYHIAYIAHAPLEPRSAVAEWNDGKLMVWTGSQRPFGVRTELMQAFGINEGQVRVIVPDTGAAYGGKHTGEAAVEAARLAKSAGKPVKRLWTREEEFTWAYFRPAGVIDIKCGASKQGDLVAWECHNYNSGPSSIRPPYDIDNPVTQFHQANSPLRQGSYRALAATANTFARETAIDELAAQLKIDPLEFRLNNLTDARLTAVLRAAAERFGWSQRKKGAGTGYGIAVGAEKGGFIATAAEVAVDREKNTVKVVRVVAAFECGTIVNPDELKNQVEGATIQGLGGALFEAIQFENGRIKNPRFSRYRVPRFRDMPQIEVVLLDRKDLPSSGAGETPIVGIAPAVGNAIFDATGIRLRSLPLVPNGLKA